MACIPQIKTFEIMSNPATVDKQVNDFVRAKFLETGIQCIIKPFATFISVIWFATEALPVQPRKPGSPVRL